MNEETARKNDKPPMSARGKLFYTLLSLEFSALASAPFLAVAGGGMTGILALAVLFFVGIAGLLNALYASLEKPRRPMAVFMLVVHGLIYGYLWLDSSNGPIVRYQRWRGATQLERERADAPLRDEVAQLLVAHRYPEARAILQREPELKVGPGAEFWAALCPPDGGLPDMALLDLLAQHGAPSGPDRLVKAAHCGHALFLHVAAHDKLPTTVRDRMGRTALMTARESKTLQHLLEQGLDVNARDARGATALMVHRSADLTRYLLEHGADPRALNGQGCTPFHLGGPARELAEIYSLLIDAGADPTLKCIGRGPLLVMGCSGSWVQDAADVLATRGSTREDRIEGLTCRIFAHEPIGESLHWPDLDLAAQGGAELLYTAITKDEDLAIEQLLAAGANPLAKTAYGTSAVETYTGRKGRSDPVEGVYSLLLEAAQRFSSGDGGRPPPPDAGI